MDRRIIFFGILLMVMSFRRTCAAPFKEPSSLSRASVLCVLPQPSDDAPGSAMTSSSHTSQQQQKAQTTQIDASHGQSSAEKSSSVPNRPGSKAETSTDIFRKDISMPSTEDQAGNNPESKTVSPAKTQQIKSSKSEDAKKGQNSTKSGSAGDQTTSAQLLDARAPDMAKFVGAPQRSGSSSGSTGSKFRPSSAGRSSYEVPGAVVFHSSNGTVQAELFGEKFDMSAWMERTEHNDQGNVWAEMDKLRGRETMSAGEIQETLQKAIPGKDYPNYSSIPTTSFRCENVHQAGFYADPEARCQVIRRCDVNAMKWSYLCPNGTLFSQITLTCQWFFDVDCSKAVQYYDYSNSRLYHSDWVLLDTPPDSQT